MISRILIGRQRPPLLLLFINKKHASSHSDSLCEYLRRNASLSPVECMQNPLSIISDGWCGSFTFNCVETVKRNTSNGKTANTNELNDLTECYASSSKKSVISSHLVIIAMLKCFIKRENLVIILSK